MNYIRFSKLNGQGNDFILINSLKQQYDLSKDQIQLMCDRHFGIGADGIILVRKSVSADFFMDYYNQDGSQAEMCGNGIRCMARFVIENKLCSKGQIKIDTRAGIKHIEVKFDKNSGKVLDINVNMGTPIFDPDRIPVNISPLMHEKGELINDLPMSIGDKEFRINCVSMGNPHCVIFLDKDEDLDMFPLENYGPKIENNPVFPNKTNVEIIKILDENVISMRVWERGVGETLACGTGACAAAVCSITLDRIKKPKVTVNLPGGQLKIYWNGNNNDVFLEGTVENTFSGEYILN